LIARTVPYSDRDAIRGGSRRWRPLKLYGKSGIRSHIHTCLLSEGGAVAASGLYNQTRCVHRTEVVDIYAYGRCRSDLRARGLDGNILRPDLNRERNGRRGLRIRLTSGGVGITRIRVGIAAIEGGSTYCWRWACEAHQNAIQQSHHGLLRKALKGLRAAVTRASRRGLLTIHCGGGLLAVHHCPGGLLAVHCGAGLLAIHCRGGLLAVHSRGGLLAIHCRGRLLAVRHCSGGLLAVHSRDGLLAVHWRRLLSVHLLSVRIGG